MKNRFDKFFSGYEFEAFKLFGAHPTDKGVKFTLWAPHAYKVDVIGSFNDWTVGYPLKKVDFRGVWEVEIPDIKPIYSYRYRIYKDEYTFHEKIDPYAFCAEKRPANASVMYDLEYYKWDDNDYMSSRKFSYDNPLSIYEVHINGFKKEDGKNLNTYKHLKETLIPYVIENGFTHIELMPIFEHPFDGSWGYQSSGFFCATSRYGTPYDLMDFIDECHKKGIGVILDVVYAHFVQDAYGLVNYDFAPLYEYDEAHLMKSEWGSYYFNLNSKPVISFLMSSANFYLDKYHFDGLRFDAISHLIYHSGNRDKGENLEGLSFMKRLNFELKEKYPSVMLIAEDSSDYPNVTKEVKWGGLGFDYKWDLGWMNDTLKYYKMDHEYRKYHHNLLTFSMAYFYNEKFLLPLSHDEVVHSKGTIIDKMFGTYEEKFHLCRNLMTLMFTHPGKKLNFMGNELAVFREFDEAKDLDWFMLDYPLHDSFARFFRDLNLIYTKNKAFYANEYDWNYFRWIDADNNAQSIYSYYRQDEKECFVVVLNMMPISYEDYEIGVPYSGTYTEIMNSEKDIYSGCNMCNFTPVKAVKKEKHKLPYTLKIRIAPFAGIIFKTTVKKPRVKKVSKEDTPSTKEKTKKTTRKTKTAK